METMCGCFYVATSLCGLWMDLSVDCRPLRRKLPVSLISFFETESLSCGWPGTHSVDKVSLNSQRSVSASLKVCAFFFFFLSCVVS